MAIDSRTMLVLVAGLPGSGKSYFAENLAARMKSVYISSDRVRGSMRARGKYSYEDKLAIYKEMLRITEINLEKDRDIVVDATFYQRVMRELFLGVAREHGATLRIIEVVADEELIKRRLEEPREFSEADFAVYIKIKGDFEKIELPHLVVKSTNDNLESMIQQSLSYLQDEGD